MEIRNAKITSTMLGREDHGILTFMLFVEFNVGCCGIGGYALDSYNEETKQRVYTVKGMEAISKILDTVGVDKWEDLVGKYIRVKENGWGSPIEEIGNIIEEKWFNLHDHFTSQQKTYEKKTKCLLLYFKENN